MSRRAGVAFSYVLLVVQIASSLLFTPYLIRSLGQAEYGIYSLVASITAYFMLLDAGIGNALVRYIAKFRVEEDLPQQRRFLGVSLAFYMAVGVVVLLLGAALNVNLPAIFGGGLTPHELTRVSAMLSVTLVNAAVTLVASTFDRTLIAYERFAVSKCLSIASVVLRVSTLTVILYLGYRALAVVTVNLILTIFFGVLSAWYVLSRLGLRPTLRGVQLNFVREIFGYSGFIFLQMIATQVNSMTDQVLLGIMTSSVVVGVYAVGAQLSQYFQSIAGSINGVLMPGVVRMVESGAGPDSLLNEMVKVGRLVLIVLGVILVGFAVTGQSFVSLWAGPSNGEAFWVGLILMVAMIMSLVQAIGAQILWAMGRPRSQTWISVGVAIVNVGLTIVLIRWNPLVGASLATAAAMLLGNVILMNIVLGRVIGISIKRYFGDLLRGILPSLIIVAAVGWAVGLLRMSGWANVAAEVLAMLVAYVVAMIWFGMSAYERQLAAPVLTRLRLSRERPRA